MKYYTNFIWRKENFDGKLVNDLRVRIFEKNPGDSFRVNRGEVIAHDGKRICDTKIIDFTYIIVSTGICDRSFLHDDNTSLYVHIKLFITDKFNAKILDTIKYPEIYWVKLAFKNYTAMKESEKEQLEFRLLKEYMKKNSVEEKYDQLLLAINNADFMEIEEITKFFSWKHKAFVWKKTAQQLLTTQTRSHV